MSLLDLLPDGRVQAAVDTARRRFGVPRILRRSIGGHTVTVRDGTVPDAPDYDDAWLWAFLDRDGAFFDVGTNVGHIALMACLRRPDREVVAIDANPRALAIAAENLFLNGFGAHARFVRAFVGERPGGEVDFYATGAAPAGSTFRSRMRRPDAPGTHFRVATTSLDALAAELGVAPALVKIDVEGAEGDVLRGTTGLARKAGPVFMVEMHGFQELPMAENGRRVLAWCDEVGYAAHYLKEHRRVTAVADFVHRGRCHLYLAPRDQELPAALTRIEQGAAIAGEPG